MTATDVYNALKHLKQSGTRDLDGLDTKILRLAAPVITITRTYVFNLCITKSTFPSAFKIAKVIPLYKSGDSSFPSNYRPVSIVSVPAKPLEKHINKHLLLPLCIKALCELFAGDTFSHDHHTDLNTPHASLQNSLENLINWTDMNHMALHPDKTKSMLITTWQKRQNIVSYFHPLTVQCITIEEV